MNFTIPEPLQAEHNELHSELARLAGETGPVGEAAKTVANLMHPHFTREEEYALPPLGLLSAVSGGKVTPEMKDVLSMTDRLSQDLPEMLKEHKAIVGVLEGLKKVAEGAGRDDVRQFADKLMLHARTEEEVLYPAALLIGEYVKSQSGQT